MPPWPPIPPPENVSPVILLSPPFSMIGLLQPPVAVTFPPFMMTEDSSASKAPSGIPAPVALTTPSFMVRQPSKPPLLSIASLLELLTVTVPPLISM